MKSLISYCIIILLLLSGCGKSDNRLYLESINTVIETEPRLAISKLDSIKDREFNKRDRAYFNLLTIKSQDKAYVKHENDSLIKDVLAFYENNQGADYAEALYYGGRVYSDLGNYPTSLNYFHRALDELPDNDSNRRLRGQVVSQLGRLLIELRLYSQAIPYLEKSIEYDKLDRDSFSLAFDYDLIKTAYLGTKDYEKAEVCTKKSILYGSNLPHEDKIYFKSCLADVKKNKGENDTALILIREIKDRISTEHEPYIWADASMIYYKNNLYDTAYIFAKKIINDHRQACKNIAYFILLKPEIKKLIPVDSLLIYYRDYESYINEYLNRHDSEQALIQTSMYNYELHERESKDAMRARNKMMRLVVVSLIVILLMALFILTMKLREKSRIIQISDAKKQIADLQSQIESLRNVINDNSTLDNNQFDELEQSINDMRSKLISMVDNKALVDSLSDFKDSNAYKLLNEKLAQNCNIITNKETDTWTILENEIQSKSPNFIKNLLFLSHGKLNDVEMKTCILIKMGMTPTQLTTLMGVVKGTLSNRRAFIGEKILGEKTSVSIADKVIRLL